MADYSSSSAIFISVISGIILYLFFDGIFILTLTGFLATYLTSYEQRTISMGIIASLVLGLLHFTYGLFLTPELPLRVLSSISFDFSGFLMGLMVVTVISILLGALGGFVATKVASYNERID